MTKLYTLILSFAILLQSCGLGLSDVLLVGELYEHAQFHKEQYGDDFFTFLSKHYGALKMEHNQQHQEEQEDHNQLPFNHHNCSDISAIAIFELGAFKDDLKFPEFSEYSETNFHYQLSISSLHSFGLFQPPQVS